MSQQAIVYDGRDLSGLAGGAATVNTESGFACIALGASSVVITNNKVALGDIVLVQPTTTIDADAPLLKCVTAAGSFTVSCCAEASGTPTAAAAKYPFAFVLVKVAL